jgi:hypothetical protein
MTNTLKDILKDMSVIDKATELNRLRKKIWSATPTEGVTIDKVLEGYNKENNMIIDSYIWNIYGLHYKDYIDVIGPYLSYCPIKLEQAIDKKIIYLNEKIKENSQK